MTDKYGNKQDFTVFVSLFNHQDKKVYALESYQNKNGSEISYARNIINNTNVTNSVFTLNALHCQKETTRIIIESKNDYSNYYTHEIQNDPPKSPASSGDLAIINIPHNSEKCYIWFSRWINIRGFHHHPTNSETMERSLCCHG